MDWIKDALFGRFEYVATIDLKSNYTVNGKLTGEVSRGYIILLQRRKGQRRLKVIGGGGNSPSAVHRRAQAEIWVNGGQFDAVIPCHVAPRREGPDAKVEGNVVHHDFKTNT